MNPHDLAELRLAVTLLENPGLVARLTNMIGMPIEKAVALLPDKVQSAIGSVTHRAIHQALRLMLKTMAHYDPSSGTEPPEASNWLHKAASATSGAVGGFMGLPALAFELPISTSIMMRSIADVARSEGADLGELQTQLECVHVLALGGNATNDDDSIIGYFVVRDTIATALSQAAVHLAKNGLSHEGAPAVVQLIVRIAERYAIPVTEKFAAQSLPIMGGVAGALINTIFIDHYQNMARGHFIVRRLESRYGEDLVRQHYANMRHSNGGEDTASSPFPPANRSLEQ
jgi:hypothetical protein